MSDETHTRRGRHGSEEILNVRRRIEERHSRGQAVVVRVGRLLSRPAFFVALLAAHGTWLAANVPAWVPWTPWDPPPFQLLAMIASVEAPFIALLILMRHAEREATAQLRLLAAIAERLGIERPDQVAAQRGAEGDRPLDLQAMRHVLDPEGLLEETERQIEESGEEPL